MFVPLLLLTLAACATRPAPDISGRWKAVNHYATFPQEIPLHQVYVFYPSPLDITLKTMLTRWAHDTHMTLSYEHPSDFTLYGPVAQLRSPSLLVAIATLSTLYAKQQVEVTMDGNAILVRRLPDAASAAASHP